jgi:hypothetical protein
MVDDMLPGARPVNTWLITKFQGRVHFSAFIGEAHLEKPKKISDDEFC